MVTEQAEVMEEARQAAEEGRSDRLIERLVDRIGGRAGVRAVFGEPIERGEFTVIPVARVRWFVGAGGGSGPVAGTSAETMGTGSGGGGGAGAVPVGYIEIGPTGASFRPIVDPYPSPAFILAAGVTTLIILRGLVRLIRG